MYCATAIGVLLTEDYGWYTRPGWIVDCVLLLSALSGGMLVTIDWMWMFMCTVRLYILVLRTWTYLDLLLCLFMCVLLWMFWWTFLCMLLWMFWWTFLCMLVNCKNISKTFCISNACFPTTLLKHTTILKNTANRTLYSFHSHSKNGTVHSLEDYCSRILHSVCLSLQE